MKFISKLVSEAKLLEEHVVLIAKTAVKLPGLPGLAAGVHHLEGDVRLLIKRAKDARAFVSCEVHVVAGDTITALKTIAGKAEAAFTATKAEYSKAVSLAIAARSKLRKAVKDVETAAAQGKKAVEADAIAVAAHAIQLAQQGLALAQREIVAADDVCAVLVKKLDAAQAAMEDASDRHDTHVESAAMAVGVVNVPETPPVPPIAGSATGPSPEAIELLKRRVATAGGLDADEAAKAQAAADAEAALVAKAEAAAMQAATDLLPGTDSTAAVVGTTAPDDQDPLVSPN